MIEQNLVKRIFLAEDDEEDVSIFTEALNELKKEVSLSVARDGKYLMEILQKAAELPDMIFLDLNMPLKNGFQCLKEIKSNQDWKDIRIVVLSTSSDSRQIKTAYSEGADLYLTKPAKFSDLITKLDLCLRMELHALKQV